MFKRETYKSALHMLNSRNAAFVYLFVWVLFLIIRNLGLYPSIFADEWEYSTMARDISFSSAALPSYLYFFIYKFTSYSGHDYLGCARLFNVLFFVASIPFVYLVAKKFTTNNIAFFIAVLSAISPLNTYTAYFMPETMYQFSFWVFAWIALNFEDFEPMHFGIISGLLIALMSMIKVHAVFLIPGFLAYITLMYSQLFRKNFIKQILCMVYFFIVTAIFVRFSLGYSFAGKAGLNIFGHAYSSILHSKHGVISAGFSNILKAVYGHSMGLALLFSIPLVTLFYNLKPSRMTIDKSRSISIFTSFIYICLLAMVIAFTAKVAHFAPYELFRIHMRYYNFASPLLLIVTASQLSCKKYSFNVIFTLLPTILVGGLIVAAVITRLLPYGPNLIDCPELLGFTQHRTLFYFLSAISLSALIVWCFNNHLGAKIFLYGFLPATILFTFFVTNNDLRNRLNPDVFDKAGLFTHQYLDKANLAKLAIAGAPGGVLHASFHVDNPETKIINLTENDQIDSTKVPADREWLLVIGNAKVALKSAYQITTSDFSLIKLSGSHVVNFATSVWPGAIRKTSGLFSAEKWGGSWSDGSSVKLEFIEPLPQNFTLHINAKAFGPNANKIFHVKVGQQDSEFKLSDRSNDLAIKFNNPGREKLIEFTIPFPTSPKELGLNSDARKLGMAFYELKIDDAVQ